MGVIFASMLGSSRVVVNSSGTLLDDSDFYPFGGEHAFTSSSGNTYKFTGKERDSETGNDDFGARFNSSTIGRFMSPDPSNLSIDFWLPQTWNRYAYCLNDPLGIVDRNGLWPWYIHNEIIDAAFPGLSKQDLQTLKDASWNMDRNPGQQDASVSFEHGMSNGLTNQDPMEAQREGDAFIAKNVDEARKAQADWIASGHTGFSPKALAAFGNALHTTEDRLSPAHAGNQPWYGTSWWQWRSINHFRRESTISQAQMRSAIDAARAAFLQTFGNEFELLAIQKRRIRACVTTFGPKGPTTTCDSN